MPKNSTQSNKPKTPKLRFPGFDGVWEEKKLGQFLIPELREIIKPKGFYKGIGLRSHFKGTFQRGDSDPLKISMDKLFEVKEKDFLVNITFAWEGALAIAKKEDEGGLVSHRFPTYVFDKKITTPEYFQFVFPNRKMKYILENISPGGAGRNRVLNKTDFLKIKINLPQLSEQQKIASFLGGVDAWIENLREQKKSLESYKKGLMQKIFSQQIRFKDEKGNDFPEWEEKRLSEIEEIGFVELGRGEVISKSDILKIPGEYPIYSSSVQNEGLFGYFGKYNFDEELISWSVDGGGNFFYRPKHKFSITNVSGYLRVLNKNILNVKFLAMQLQLLHEKQKFDYTVKAHPSVIRGIYIIKIPNLLEQQKIAEFLSSVDTLIESKQQQITKAEEWKKGLMQNLFV